MAAHASSGFELDSLDSRRRACVICGTRSLRSKAADTRPANPSGWGRVLAYTGQFFFIVFWSIVIYTVSGAGLVLITMGGYPDWVACFIVGSSLLAVGLTEKPVVAR